MKKLVPLNKQSKKAQKEHAASQRSTWDNVSPVPRVVESAKKYSRKRFKPNRNEDE